jgi:signal transduction histidine kinase
MKEFEERCRQLEKVSQVISKINEGLTLAEIMDCIYQEFRGLIPYDRMGLSLIEDGGKVVRAVWGKSALPKVCLPPDYTAALLGSSLEEIVRTNQPRVINNLAAYLENKPGSESTRLIVEEGIRASLTCPLIAGKKAVGFLFFSSKEVDAYAGVHVERFEMLAEAVSLIVEKGRLVTELIRQKEAMDKQNDELRQLNDTKNTFLGMAAHDLRGGVGTIKAVAELLLNVDQKLSIEDRENLLQSARRQSTYMLSLIDGLLDVNRIEAGKLTLNKEKLDLRGFLQTLVADHGKLATLKNISVVLRDAPAQTIVADPVRLRQIADNLISNAVKFSPRNSTILVQAKLREGGCYISVKDQGPGLTAEDRKSVFQDYRKLSAQPTGGEKSFGLGLAITRRVVEAHGGRIGVDSEPGKGATFWFVIP